jgi:AraC-like DNA-binding protein
MNAARNKDPLADLIDHTVFRLLAGGFERIRRDERYAAKSPFSRLLLCKRGRGQIESRGAALIFKPGQLVFVPTEVEATYIKPRGLEFYWVYFRADCFGCIDFFRLCAVPCLGRMSPGSTPVFKRMLANMHSSRLTERVQVLMDLLLLLGPFLAQCRSDRSLEKHRQLIRLLPVLSFIEEHLKESGSLRDLAARVALNPVYFSNLFSSTMGMPPIRYINHRRIERSKELLLISQLSIKEIAAQLGFEDPLYFSRVFQKQEGLPPLRYRQTGFQSSSPR